MRGSEPTSAQPAHRPLGHRGHRTGLPTRGVRPRPGPPRSTTTPVAAARSAPATRRSCRPALETYGSSGDWSLRVVPNKYPAFEGSGEMHVERLGPAVRQGARHAASTRCWSSRPEHEQSWADLDDRQAGLVMAALRDRLEDHAAASGIRYSQAIVNHGRAAGRQPAPPPRPAARASRSCPASYRGAGRVPALQGGCLLCATVEAERDAGPPDGRRRRRRGRGRPLVERRPVRAASAFTRKQKRQTERPSPAGEIFAPSGAKPTAPPAPPPIAAAKASAASSSGNVAATETSSFPAASSSASSPSARPSGSTITDEISMPRCSSGGS